MMDGVKSVKILIFDAHAVVASGIALILGGYPDFDVIGHVDDFQTALQLCNQKYPDIICIDINIPGETSGIDAIYHLRNLKPPPCVIVLTNNLEEEVVRAALMAGVSGYLLKSISADGLAHAIRTAYQGQAALSPDVAQLLAQPLDGTKAFEPRLSSREHQVLELIERGLTNREIAAKLDVSLSTVQFHVKNILRKLHVHNRIEAATLATRQEFLVENRKDHSRSERI